MWKKFCNSKWSMPVVFVIAFAIVYFYSLT